MALHSLDSINPDDLSESDRHFYDFLTIKARDKAFITHESDSLILDVIDYYSAYQSDPIYPEALYYGGRVYYELGDYPSALQYFQQALDNPGQAPDTTDLKNRLNSQIGGMLGNVFDACNGPDYGDYTRSDDNICEGDTAYCYRHGVEVIKGIRK